LQRTIKQFRVPDHAVIMAIPNPTNHEGESAAHLPHFGVCCNNCAGIQISNLIETYNYSSTYIAVEISGINLVWSGTFFPQRYLQR
jgi:hypothetical protein